MVLIMQNLGKSEAYKQNHLLFKFALHVQDIYPSGQEADLEEFICDRESYEDYLYSEMQSLGLESDYNLFCEFSLGVKDLRSKVKILSDIIQHSGNHKQTVFPKPLRALEALFRAYFENVDGKYLDVYAASPGKSASPIDAIFDHLSESAREQFDLPIDELKQKVTRWAQETREQRNNQRSAPTTSALSNRILSDAGLSSMLLEQAI